jgi:hypothetical protein
MVFDNEAGAQYLYGGVDRLRANTATSQAAYAEAGKRAASDRNIAAATTTLALATRQERQKSQFAEMLID